jgi:hypothetical protein
MAQPFATLERQQPRPVSNLFGIEKMKYTSSHKPYEIIDILNEQVDRLPSLMRSTFTLNAHCYWGTLTVCGKIKGYEFELRNRSGHAFSLRVLGAISVHRTGSQIELVFHKPVCLDLLGLMTNRYKEDKRKILAFLEKWIKLSVVPNQ